MEYIVYCDESSTKGEKYTDFFGGCIVEEARQTFISNALNEKKAELGIQAEIKWTKVSAEFAKKYCQLIHLFFDYIRSGDIRFRVMFRKTENQYSHHERPLHDERYFKLY